MNEQSAPKPKILIKTPKAGALAASPDSAPPAPAWSSEQQLVCPIGKTPVFARVPRISVRGGPTFPAGDVFLRYGEHFGYNNGFGFQHIWREHFHHIKDHDAAMEAVRNAIAGILRPTAPIFYDATRAGNRAAVHRLHAGIVIIQMRAGAPPHYSVVTGGFNPAKTKGSLVGALV